MFSIAYDDVVRAVRELAIAAAYHLPSDVVEALEAALARETSAQGRKCLEQILENARLAGKEELPICQDTGLAVIFVEQGNEVYVPGGLTEAINKGITDGYEQGYLRKSVVAEPLDKRCNTGTNTPAIIHHQWADGSDLKITLLAKGGGAENRSRLGMLKPSDGREGVFNFVIETVKRAGADACPPFVVGVGIGGNFEVAPLLAKRALLRKLNSHHPEKYYGQMEGELLKRVNALGIGPQGLGGDTTALAVLIETAACHIASLPVAVNIECHAHRHKSITLKALKGKQDG